MNERYTKILASAAGIVVMTTAVLPFAFPEHAAAKWIKQTTYHVIGVKDNANEAVPIGTGTLVQVKAVDEVDNVSEANEAVVVEVNGETKRVAIAEAIAKPIVVAIDQAVTEKLQQEAAAGQKAWLLDPVGVIKNTAAQYGFNAAKDSFTLVSRTYRGEYSGTGEARVLVSHNGRYYLVALIQPAGPGNNNVWQVSSIQEVKVVTQNSSHNNSKVDVGPGVEGLDYDKVIKWQQAVDAGRERWRLDPLKVARIEGKNYGFTDKDTFTIVRQYSSTTLARHGQVNVEVNHEGKIYTMILVKPFGGGDAIWTTYKVTGPKKPDTQEPDQQKPDQQPDNDKPAAGKIIFDTDKYSTWQWHKDEYLQDMAFTVIVDYDAQATKDKRIPETVLNQAKDVDYDDRVVLFAYLGTAPTGGYGIGIEKVTVNGNTMTVKVHTKSPAPGQSVTLAQTRPYDFITIDRKLVDIWGGMNITFVDQNGTVLNKTKVTISHR